MWSVALFGLLAPGYLVPRGQAGLRVAPARAHFTRSPTFTSATTWLPEHQLPQLYVKSNDLTGREATTLYTSDSNNGITTVVMPTDPDIVSTSPTCPLRAKSIKVLAAAAPALAVTSRADPWACPTSWASPCPLCRLLTCV